MYSWIWNHLPGPVLIRVLISLVTIGLLVAVLFAWIFPWLEPRLPFTDVTVQSPSSTGLSTAGDRITAV